MSVLFLTWDGPTTAYLESLYFPVLSRLGTEAHVLQFTFAPKPTVERVRAAARAAGVGFTAVPALRLRPVAASTLVMIGAGAPILAREVRRRGTTTLLVRSIIPAMMTLLARPLLPEGLRIVFDADGFGQDEKVEFGGWNPQGAMYRAWRDAEAQMIRVADVVLTRTQRAREVLLARAGAGTEPSKIVVVPNGSNEGRFSPESADDRAASRQRLGVPADVPVLMYCGSLGPQYFPDLMLDLLEAVRARGLDARLVGLTGAPDLLLGPARARGIPDDRVLVQRVPPEEVPPLLAASDLGLAFRAPSFSQRGVSPIKVGEYLLCGLPVVTNLGVGDLDAVLEGETAAFVIDRPVAEQLAPVAEWFVKDVLPRRPYYREAARSLGVTHFGLEQMVRGYRTAVLSRADTAHATAAS